MHRDDSYSPCGLANLWKSRQYQLCPVAVENVFCCLLVCFFFAHWYCTQYTVGGITELWEWFTFYLCRIKCLIMNSILKMRSLLKWWQHKVIKNTCLTNMESHTSWHVVTPHVPYPNTGQIQWFPETTKLCLSYPLPPSCFYETSIQLECAHTSGGSVTRVINTFSVCKARGNEFWTAFANPRCGLLPQTQKKLQCNSCQKAALAEPEIPLLCAAEIAKRKRIHNSFRYLWLGLRHSSRMERTCALQADRPTFWLSPASDLGQAISLPWASVFHIWED